ncbi:MAG: hypothetical protein L0331_13640 [Chloroflexi bacterium]|nr:hypothetical protein [Chloroflexota bacterium]MCI0649404.1 hypothetical protein [Chloroflexota bacterium]
MLELLPRIKQHFDVLQDRLSCFCELGFQSEGWFKGELLTLFHRLHKEGLLTEVDREVRVGSKRIDVMVRYHDKLHWIELKHWLIGKQRGTSYNAGFYFGDPTSVGILQDVSKLDSLPAPGQRWLLLLLAANPGLSHWEAGVQKFNIKFAPYQLQSWTQPDQFPSSYFLGLLELMA